MATYACIALLSVLPSLLEPGTVPGDGVDLYGTLWFYWWAQDCLLELRNPSFTDLFFHPLGKDIFAHTGNNLLDALGSAPFQWILGFPSYYPWFVAVVLFGNALAFRPLVRRVLVPDPPRATAPAAGAWRRLQPVPLPPSAFTAVLLWQTSSYALFEITCGRLTQAFLWFLPLAVDRFLALEAPHPRKRDALLAGLLIALQAWTYWFTAPFTLLLLAWLAAGALVRAPKRRRLAGRYVLAALAALLVVAPAVLPMAMAASQGAVPGLTPKTLDVLALPGVEGNNVARTLHGWWLMERLGAPLLGYPTWLAVLAVSVGFGRERVRWIGGSLLVLLFALGPAVDMGGTVRNVPYLLAYHLLPFFDRLWFPYRGVFVVFLCVLLCFAMALDRIGARLRAGRWLLFPLAVVGPLVVVGVNLADQHRTAMWPFVTRDVTPPRVVSVVGERTGGVIHLPIGINQPAIVWQTVHHQPLFGGMGENAPLLWPEGYRSRLSQPFVAWLRRTVTDPARAVEPPPEVGRQRLLSEGFRWVLLHRDLVDSFVVRSTQATPPSDPPQTDRPFETTALLVGVLGPPVAVEGPLVLWSLERDQSPVPGLEPTQEALTSRTWSPEDQPLYEQRLQARGRLPRDGAAPSRDNTPGR